MSWWGNSITLCIWWMASVQAESGCTRELNLGSWPTWKLTSTCIAISTPPRKEQNSSTTELHITFEWNPERGVIDIPEKEEQLETRGKSLTCSQCKVVHSYQPTCSSSRKRKQNEAKCSKRGVGFVLCRSSAPGSTTRAKSSISTF